MVLLIKTEAPLLNVDIDEVQLRSIVDSNLSDYLKIVTEDASGFVVYAAKTGDHRFIDVDDSDASDAFQITADDADGGVLQKTSQITDGAIWEIQTSGTYSGASATVDIDYLLFDIDATTINDGAANAVTLRGIYQDWDGITMTAVTLSSITGISILLPSGGELATERGILVNADKSVVSNNAIALETSRDISGTLAAAESFTNYANIFGQAVAHSGGDFILTHDEGVLKLVMAQSTTVACTSPDVFSGTALYIDIDADVNVGTSDAKVDCSARALDIAYTLAETDGVMRTAATDIARITYTMPTGLSSAGAHQIDVLEINLDNVIANDANLTLNGIYIDASGLTNTSSADLNLINILAPDDSNIDAIIKLTADTTTANSTVSLVSSRDINGTVAGAVALTNYASVLGQAVSHSGGDFIVTQTAGTAGILQLNLDHSTTLACTAPDVFASTALDINVTADVNVGTSDAKVDASARAIDITYALSETDGVMRWATTDIFRIDFNTAAALTSAAAAAINMILLDADGVTINDSNVSMDAIKVDMSSLTLTDASSLHGIEITIPTLVGQATTRYAAYFNDGTVTTKVVDGSMGVTATGINDEKYYRCEDFDEEAAAVTLDAGVRGDEWTFGGTNGDAGDVTYIQGAGGLIRMETDGADNDSVYALWLNTAVYTTANPIIEFRVRVDAVTASLTGFAVGLAEAGAFTTMAFDAVDDDYILIGMDSDLGTPANLRMYTEDNNGGITTVDTGTAISANTWCTIRIDCTDTEQPRVFINNTGGAITPSHEIAAGTITGTIQAGIYMYPVLFVICLDATPSARHFDVDYIKIWQDRA